MAVLAHSAHVVLISVGRIRGRLAGDGGQTSVEYALVLLGAAAIALLIGAWAGGTDKVAHLLDVMFDSAIDKAKG